MSRCCSNRACPWHASELVSFLVRLWTCQYPGIVVQKILIVMLNYNKNSFLMASSNVEDSVFLQLTLFEIRQWDWAVYIRCAKIFQKSRNHFKIPVTRRSTCSMFRTEEIRPTTQICHLGFIHPCCILLTNSAQITRSKQNFEVFYTESSRGNCVFVGGYYTLNIQCQNRLQLLYERLSSMLICNILSQNVFIKAKSYSHF